MTEMGEFRMNNESISRVQRLAKSIETAKVFGETSPEAEERARNLLGSSFGSSYESVLQMDEISKDRGKPDQTRKNAKNSLEELGAAMCLVADGRAIDLLLSGDLRSSLPENMQGIEEFVAKNMFMDGSDDETGKMIVSGLVRVEKMNNKAKLAPKAFGEKKISETKEVISDLVERFDSVDPESLAGQKLSAVVGYLDETLVGRETRSGTSFRPAYNEEGERINGVEAAWQVTPEKLAESMLFMDSVRWQSYTPPEWFKALDVETQIRIETMILVSEGAFSLMRAGKDLDRILGNPLYFSLDGERMTKLFNGDFKLGMSKILNDLCEFHISETGSGDKIPFLRYKEEVNKDGVRVIKKSVKDEIENIRDYKEKLCLFLAKKNNRAVPNYMDRMNAYTAWNLFFVFGDSSVADRMRLLPTYGGIICDPLRTLNPESKAHGKLKISKGEKELSDDDLFEAEYFGGEVGTHLEDMLKLERDLKENIGGGSKSLRKKIIDGDLPLFRYRMCYGLLDFIGEKDLYTADGKDDKGKVSWKPMKSGKKETLASLLMNYASFNKDGELISHKDPDFFSFGERQVDFLNWYRDHQEAAALSFNCLTSKAEVKDVSQFARLLKDKIGMLRGLNINGRRLEYSTKPDYWANIIWGSLPIDKDRLSTDYIRLRVLDSQGKDSEAAYSFYVNNVLKMRFGLTDTEVDIYKIMNLLGLSIKRGEDPGSIRVSIRNEKLRRNDYVATSALRRKQREFYKA